jgi:hypothetical protein
MMCIERELTEVALYLITSQERLAKATESLRRGQDALHGPKMSSSVRGRSWHARAGTKQGNRRRKTKQKTLGSQNGRVASFASCTDKHG